MILSDETILARMNDKYYGYNGIEFSPDIPMIAEGMSNPHRIEIDPFNLDDLQGASVDLRLGAEIIFRGKREYLSDYQSFFLSPGHTCLAQTSARVHTPHDCVARVEGKSSIGRQFVLIHCTAGWLDPGFDGYVTLELANLSSITSFLLEVNMPICQLTFIQMDRPAERQYKGKYQHAKGVEAHKS